MLQYFGRSKFYHMSKSNRAVGQIQSSEFGLRMPCWKSGVASATILPKYLDSTVVSINFTASIASEDLNLMLLRSKGIWMRCL